MWLFVSPTNLHCSQTLSPAMHPGKLFVSPTNLHRSQTNSRLWKQKRMFVSPTNLHCSQTRVQCFCNEKQFVFPTNLHCSQTKYHRLTMYQGLFPLRIYTALKRPRVNTCQYIVCFPYEFTLLSNQVYGIVLNHLVCFPYEFTLLSNTLKSRRKSSIVCFPYEFTLLSNAVAILFHLFLFVSPTNLHCSQTNNVTTSNTTSLFPLRIYTALKLQR